MIKNLWKNIKYFNSHTVKPESLVPGDHIYVWRSVYGFLLYNHHGIYSGNGKVIHFTTREPDTQEDERIVQATKIQMANAGFFQKIFHNMRKAYILETNMDYFLTGGKLKKARYDVSTIEFLLKARGTCYRYSIIIYINILYV